MRVRLELIFCIRSVVSKVVIRFKLERKLTNQKDTPLKFNGLKYKTKEMTRRRR